MKLSSDHLVYRPSSIHGLGAFATRSLPPGARVVEYTGEKIDKQESLRRLQANNPFIFALDEQWDLDGSVEWNLARHLNHSCAPNCEAMHEEGRIWIFTMRAILPGEELTFNYGYGLEEYREHPCRCGTSECVGFMVAEEFFPKLRAAREYQLDAGTMVA